MNKVLFLVALVPLPLMPMNGPEGPEDWQQISLVDLRVEVNGVPENCDRKREFMEEQIKRRDDALEEAKNFIPSHQHNDKFAMLLNLKKEYYTARDIDDLLFCIKQAKTRKRIIRAAKLVNSKTKA